MAAAAPAPLRLLVEDTDDLAIVSAALQDAVARIGDIQYEPAARQLTFSCNRFRWERDDPRGGERIRSALQLAGVTKLQARGLRRDAPEAVINLMAVTFEPSGEEGDPGGTVMLQFSGDADLRAQVECLDAVLADVSDPWPTPRRPGHGEA